MGRWFLKILSVILVLQLSYVTNTIALATSACVIPIHDGVSDETADDLADSFSAALSKKGLEMVSREKVDAVLKYYNPPPQQTSYIKAAEDALLQARDHYFNFDYREAMAQIETAIKILEAEPNKISEHGVLLRDIYITAAIIEKSDGKDLALPHEYFKKALKLDPNYELDAKSFSPSTAGVFNKARAGISGLPTGSIKIDSDPQVAEVFINGVQKGVTPIVISDLPADTYHISIKTNKYRPVEKTVTVVEREILKIKERLTWQESEGNTTINAAGEPKDKIEEGVRIAELLRVQKVVMLDIDQNGRGSGEISLRMVDRQYKAGHNPIVVAYYGAREGREGFEDNLLHATELLIKQANTDITKDPTALLEPDGIGDTILLGKRRRQFVGTSVFWGLLGGIVAAGTGGAVAALAGGDSRAEATTGSVNVQFK